MRFEARYPNGAPAALWRREAARAQAVADARRAGEASRRVVAVPDETSMVARDESSGHEANPCGVDDVVAALRAIMARDRSPLYAYGEADPRGDRPARGSKWLAPRETAELLLMQRRGLLRLTDRQRSMVVEALERAGAWLPVAAMDPTADFDLDDVDEFRGLAHLIRRTFAGERE